MNVPLTIIDLAGTVALLLWGVRMVQTGIQRAFGPQLGQWLALALDNRLKAFSAGVVVTAILQSSTATGLMITGFASGGLVDLVPALAVMLGANVGTTLIVQALSFDVVSLAPALFLAGFVMFQRGEGTRTRDLGRVSIGLGLMVLSLRMLLNAITPYEDVPSLRMFLGAISTEPVLALLLGALVSWAAHSSVAIVLLVMSLATKGVVPPYTAFVIVLGANLGAAVNPLLEGAGSTADPASRRLPFGNLVARAVGCGTGLLLLPWLAPWILQIVPEAGRAVADFHTAFNLCLAAVFLPLLAPYAALLRRCFPARIDPADPGRPRYLHSASLAVPPVALGAAARETLRLADALEAMVQGARDTLTNADRHQIAGTRRMDEVLDRLNTAIKAYLAGLDPAAMTDADHQRAEDILTFALHLEQAGDVVAQNLIGLAARRRKRGLSLPPTEQAEIVRLLERLLANLHAAAAVFASGDARAARALAAEKEMFRDIEARATRAHFQRLRGGNGPDAGGILLDALRGLKQINAHLVAGAAYPILRNQGALLASRLRQDG